MSASRQMKEFIAGASELGIVLSGAQVRLFEEYLDRILSWNRRRNIVSRRDEGRIGAYHFVDSLSAHTLLPRQAEFSCLDVGSGAGFPGIPLKILMPGMRLVLAEPKRWRYLFLEDVVSHLRIPGVSLFRERVEDLPAGAASFDAILIRAVARLRSVIPITLPRLSPGGIIIAYKSGDVAKEIAEAEREMSAGGGNLQRTESLTLPCTGARRVLVVIRKS
jgi:16S rRNA (guanine527-N7)-methyltransferase